jgi:ABC-2 type transport system ATP-binding protein
MSESVIEVRDFRKCYGEFVAVNNISFEVERGEIYGLLGPNGAGKTSTLESLDYGLLGPNGAGKTSTLESLEGLRVPDAGSLRVAGVDPSRDVRGLRNLIGVQLQTSGLPANITVDEAMNFFCAYHAVRPNDELIDRLGRAP